METLRPASALGSEASTSGQTGPATPPYTPAKQKRPLERSDSPASSIHPAETSSPARKFARRAAHDTITVEELTEGDRGYLTDIDVVYPEELEEIEDDTDSASQSEADTKSESGISTHLANLRCGDETEMQKKRRERRLGRRTGSRVFKRSHSQSVNSDTEITDSDAMDDQDVEASARRLRRRVQGPTDGVKLVFNDIRSSPDLQQVREATEQVQHDEIRDETHEEGGSACDSDAMEIE